LRTTYPEIYSTIVFVPSQQREKQWLNSQITHGSPTEETGETGVVVILSFWDFWTTTSTTARLQVLFLEKKPILTFLVVVVLCWGDNDNCASCGQL